MGNKDKDGRNTKKAAARSLKQKRAEKKVAHGPPEGVLMFTLYATAG